MKITKIKVSGYKNLNNCEMKLEDFNVLIGANNSGKSNFLELFRFLDYVIDGNDEIRQYIFERNYIPSYGYFQTINSKNYETSLEIEFTDNIGDDIYKYWYNIVLKNVCKTNDNKTNDKKDEKGYIKSESFKYKNIRTTGIPKTIFERIDSEFVKIIVGQKQLQIDKTITALSIINKLTDVKNELDTIARLGLITLQLIAKTFVIYSSPNDIKTNLIGNKEPMLINGRISTLSLNDEIIKILKSDKSEFFIDVLRDILGIKDIIKIDYPNNNEQELSFIFVQYPNGTIQRLYQLSDGTVIVLNLIVYLFSTVQTIIAIEEIENSIHPKLLQKLILLMKNNFSEKQIIITTHSPVILNMVQINEVSIFISKECGNTEIIKVKDKKELVKKLSQPMASFGDIFFMTEGTYENE